jgi:hypothetical protein
MPVLCQASGPGIDPRLVCEAGIEPTTPGLEELSGVCPAYSSLVYPTLQQLLTEDKGTVVTLSYPHFAWGVPQKSPTASSHFWPAFRVLLGS